MNLHFSFLVFLICLSFSASFLAVPLYQLFCATTGYGGSVTFDTLPQPAPTQLPQVTIHFESFVDTSFPYPISFVPQTKDLRVEIGQSALVFYTVINPNPFEVSGISTYNVLPHAIAPYFHKIQCFCFDEQRWGPGDHVDMPILFFLDPLLLADPGAVHITHITLSYSLFPTSS